MRVPHRRTLRGRLDRLEARHPPGQLPVVLLVEDDGRVFHQTGEPADMEALRETHEIIILRSAPFPEQDVRPDDGDIRIRPGIT